MKKFVADQIQSIHLELTTRCNALCPMCARTDKGVARKHLIMTELSLDDIKTIFPEATLTAIRSIDLCGAFGDPLAARDLDNILVYLCQNPDRAVDLYTNGSLRPARWWQELPDVLSANSKVCFGIDGLADTNSLYRVATKFSTIMRNAAAFIGQGGRAQWDFLVFRHNQHQVDAARLLSREMGFQNFSVKVSGRFLRRFYEETPDAIEDHSYASFPVFAGDGKHAYDLEPPDDPIYQNPSHARMQKLVSTSGTLRSTFDQCQIRCLSIARNSIFVTAEGTTFPCCWTYIASKNGPVLGMTKIENLQIARLLESHGGLDAINAKRLSLKEIVSGPFFEALGQSWRASTLAEGKPKVCARVCGGCFSPIDAYADTSLSPYNGPDGRLARPA